MTADARFTAYRMGASAFDRIAGPGIDVLKKADNIILEAERKAKEILAEIARKEAKFEQRMKDVTEEEVRKYIDAETIRQNAAVFVRNLENASSVQAEFAKITPWLTVLIRQIVTQIVGDLDEDDRISRAVQVGMRSMDISETVTFLVNPGSRKLAELAFETYPERFLASTRIVTDISVPVDHIRLKGSGVLLDICWQAQLEEIIDQIQTALTTSGENDGSL